jgi:hypothetical protein
MQIKCVHFIWPFVKVSSKLLGRLIDSFWFIIFVAMLPRLMLRKLLSLHLKCSMVGGDILGRTLMAEIVKMGRPE